MQIEKTTNRFNLRVYGICVHDGKILITREWIKGREMTKFPGGGIQYGEGIIDALKREFIEETKTEVVSFSHFYTEEEFVQSQFNPNDQLISFYYLVKLKQPPRARSFWEIRNEKRLTLGWFDIDSLHHLKFTFPIDQKVKQLLLKTNSVFQQ